MTIDLLRFCAYPGMHEERRSWTEKPFSCGDFSYATNGHIMVRVPRRSDVPEAKVKGRWDVPFRLDLRSGMQFVPLRFDLPEAPQTGRCPDCAGDGRFDNGMLEFECELCRGKGWIDSEAWMSTDIGVASFNLSYVRRMAELPGICVALPHLSDQWREPLQFTFDGGIGSLMPLTARWPEHVEVCSLVS
jgi:hypothetical protein